MRTVAVIGGGASGMMAAVTAAAGGAHVILLEHKDRIGKRSFQQETEGATSRISIRNRSVIIQKIRCFLGRL